jgi:signal transduction histidine kinase
LKPIILIGYFFISLWAFLAPTNIPLYEPPHSEIIIEVEESQHSFNALLCQINKIQSDVSTSWLVVSGLFFSIMFLLIYRQRAENKKVNLLLENSQKELKNRRMQWMDLQENWEINKLNLEQQIQFWKRKSQEVGIKNLEIQHQSLELKEAYEEISTLNANLENIVKIRTEQLEKANSELDTFLYRASHDLRRPISSILGVLNVAMLHKEVSSQNSFDLHDLFDKIQLIATGMEKTLAKLLMVSTVNTLAKQEIIMEKIQLSSVISEVIKEIEKNGIHIKDIIQITHLEEEGFECYTNIMLLKIVLYNLIENSIIFKQTYSDEPSSLIIKGYMDEESSFISLEDNGIGIDTKHHKNLFDMYYRASERSQGNGLGLYVVKKAMEVMNGEIYLESAVGQGSMFELRFPNKKV